ncbi:methyl-accepting chemotaxis protein [Marinobacter sp.]|uniref:methyl-accepting chemotaxis protein n=1 Tax=Marinobacter sp. TaxID=50741 RepID=UPI0023556B57|nr:methyl-accepting chemotaxis protein [Marinobacter sp.]
MSSPRFNISIRARAILLFTLLIGLSIASSALVYQRIAGIGASVDRQAESIREQVSAIGEQSELIDGQRALAVFSEGVTAARQHLGAMQYWYFHAALNADRESLEKAEASSNDLSLDLQALATADPGLSSQVDEMMASVKQYRLVGTKMFEFFDKSMMLMGRSMAEVAREEAVSLAGQLDNIEAAYQQRELELTEGVLQAGAQVRAASEGVAESGRTIREEIDQAAGVSLAMAAVLVVAAILLGTLFLHSLLKPVRHLGQRIVEIQSANDLRGTLGYERRDELSVIAHAFDQMLARFGGLIGHVANSSSELGDVASRGRESSQSLSEQVGRQQHETGMVASAANEVTATAEGVRKNADRAASLSDEVSDLTGQGGQSADQSVVAMTCLEERIEGVASTMRELSKRSEAIGRVVDVIRGISEKTNLLALNAAIEAARAGDMGCGFAIVADEVRGLAQQTANSTSEIDELVSSLQKEADNAVGLVELSRQDSLQTRERIRECSSSLALIDDKAKEVRALNQHVAQAAFEQSEAVRNIDENLINLKNQIEEISGSARSSQSMTNTLASLSDVLKENICQFRY